MKYSFIIPNHNQQDLLQRCLDSIPMRDDVEVIIVDDNSDSNKVDFCNYPGTDRPNTKIVYNKEAKGAGHARNIALEHATGDWLIFSDSDDTFNTKDLLHAFAEYGDSDNDIVYFDVNCIDSIDGSYVDNIHGYTSIIRSSKDRENLCRYHLKCPWGKMVKRQLITDHSIMFEETPVANDAMFSLQTGHFAKKVAISNLKIYNWYIHINGSITTKRSKDAALCHFWCGVRCNEFKCKVGKYQYRGNLFMSFPNLCRCGVKFTNSLYLVISNTPAKYLLKDMINATTAYLKK